MKEKLLNTSKEQSTVGSALWVGVHSNDLSFMQRITKI